MLSSSDLEKDDNDNIIRVFRDSITGAVLVFEEVCWSTRRYVYFEPTKYGWAVRFCYLPSRLSANPTIRSEAVGLRDGKVYFEADGETYAMPVADLPEENDLGFGLG